jgi:hypothetical protein
MRPIRGADLPELWKKANASDPVGFTSPTPDSAGRTDGSGQLSGQAKLLVKCTDSLCATANETLDEAA